MDGLRLVEETLPGKPLPFKSREAVALSALRPRRKGSALQTVVIVRLSKAVTAGESETVASR